MVEKSNGITEVEAAVAAKSDVVSNDVVAARAAGGIGVSTAGNSCNQMVEKSNGITEVEGSSSSPI